MCAGLIMLICRQVAQGHIMATYHFPKFQYAMLLFFSLSSLMKYKQIVH